MRSIFTALLFLLGSCSGIESVFLAAKTNSDQELCFDIYEPANINGRYCLQYIGNTRSKQNGI